MKPLSFFLAAAIAAAAIGPAVAAGTALVQQRDGSVKVYHDVYIQIRNEELSLTTADGVGTLVIGKAACSKAGELVKCLPYDATLYQNGWKDRVKLVSGTAWFNPTASAQPLSHSSAHIPPHGVLLSVTSKAGTYVSLTGTVDEMKK
ncbi:MAG TPA: hypothetical protein VFE36_16690 [Candidatus Baltobacteraceae bacterium]|jgi:hypothetical protein|nr:hypothetical protein [Candidatus Baltobacteraceae bacterium]